MERKTTEWTFQGTKKQNLIQENLDMAKKGNFKRETESLLQAAQINTIRTNFVKAKKDKA